MVNNRKVGNLIIPGDVNVWPHEEKTARALTAAGLNVTFKRASEIEGQHSADAYVDGALWEFKSPRSGKISSIEDNLKKASRQSDKVVFDSHRMSKLPDNAIERELIARSHTNKSLIRVIFVNRHRKIVDIK